MIACANLANLLLARSTVREREIAVRQAIGASRARIVLQLMSESLLLGALGVAGGIGLAQVLSHALVAFLSTDENPLFVPLGLDWRVLGFTAIIGCATCLLFGLMPALRSTRIAPATAMRCGGRGSTAGRERFGLRRAMMVTQVALSLVLLVGALLFTRSLRNLLTSNMGFQSEGIIAVDVDLPQRAYAPERREPALRDLLDKVAAQPGVRSAAQVALTPIGGSSWNNRIEVEGTGAPVRDVSWFNRVSPRFFSTMGTGLIAGREFDARDTRNAPPVAIVNEVFASQFLAGQNPVGRTLRVPGQAGEPDEVYQIVGLVRKAKYRSLQEEFAPITYLATAQSPDKDLSTTFVVRISGPVGDTFTRIKSIAGELNPGIGLQFRVLDVMIQRSLTRERLMATLSAGFGFLAALLATIGLYGVISYLVARRRNEIGIRMALGASRGSVVGMVLREAVVLLGIGLGVGLAIALVATRWAESLLFGLKPNDPVTVALAIATLAVVALLASCIPANRAGRLDPLTALHEE